MKRYVVLAVAVLLVVLAALAGTKVMQIRKLIATPRTVPPETVSSAVVREEKWQDSLYNIASISAVQGILITAEMSGIVREIAFESGAEVAKGDLLVKLDTTSEEAQLRALEAQADLARINLDRARKLRADNTVSQSELDTAEATLKQTLANADAVRAAIDKKTIRAPFAGKLGVRLVSLGQFVDAGKTSIVSLQSMDTVYADFVLPQQNLSVLRTGMVVQLTSDTYPGETFTGAVTSINPDLNSDTRSIRLQATLANADHRLRPGMFTRIQVLLPGERDVLAIPATAVFSAPYGDSVYVIEASTNGTGGLVARQQFIRTGTSHGDFVSVAAGLKAGDRVASSGLFKLRNGSGVVENNELAPKAEKSPRPSNS